MRSNNAGKAFLEFLTGFGCVALVAGSLVGAAIAVWWTLAPVQLPAEAEAAQAAIPAIPTDAPPSDTPTFTPTSQATPPAATPTITPPAVTPLPPGLFLAPMSHEYQKLNNCGPASLSAAVSYLGVNITQFDAADVVKGGPGDKNVSPDEMVAYLNSLGLGAVYRVNGNQATLQRLAANSIPVIVAQWLSRPGDGVLVGHYRVVRGYDLERGIFIVNDPYTGPEFSISFEQFEEWWRPFNRGYIPVYHPEQAGLAANILGEDWSAEANHQRALAQAQLEAESIADGYAFFNLGDEYLALGKPEAAVTAYNNAFTFEFPEHFLWYQFGPLDAYNQAGEYQRVLNMTAALIAEAGEVEEARLERGVAYLGLDNPAAARVEIEKALAANPRYARAQRMANSE